MRKWFHISTAPKDRPILAINRYKLHAVPVVVLWNDKRNGFGVEARMENYQVYPNYDVGSLTNWTEIPKFKLSKVVTNAG